MVKAVFFDRDATLIKDIPYLHNPEEVEYFDDTLSVLKELQDAGYLLFMITNQSGIGRGYFKTEQMHEVHEQMVKDFAKHSIKLAGIEFCPHSPEDNCDCRKPHPKMINTFLEKFDIDLKNSYMIGDKPIDAEAGINAGINGVILGSSNEHKAFPTLTLFKEHILKEKM
jgi:D,D-heptose 1,7-bisphosphate phosphatase